MKVFEHEMITSNMALPNCYIELFFGVCHCGENNRAFILVCVSPQCAVFESMSWECFKGRFPVVDGGWDMCMFVCVCVRACMLGRGE